MNNYFKSLGYCILSSLCISSTIDFDFIGLIKIINWEEVDFFASITIGVLAWGALLLLFADVIFPLKAIYHMILTYKSVFFNRNSEIHLSIDENNFIKGSFVKLANGKIIPIKISKVKCEEPKDKEETSGE